MIAHDICLMLVDNRHGGLNLSFIMAYLEYSSLLTVILVCLHVFRFLVFYDVNGFTSYLNDWMVMKTSSLEPGLFLSW